MRVAGVGVEGRDENDRWLEMVKILSILLVVSFTLTSYGFAEKYQIISEGGKSEWCIVISDTASPSEKTAASELQKFLKEISGAELPIITDKEPISQHEIVLGDNAHLNELKVDIDFKKLGVDGCTIRTAGGHLIIAGSKKRGTLYGVYTFLDKYLGCRWFPIEISRIPKVNKIEFGDIDYTLIPAMKYRSLAAGYNFQSAPRVKLNKHVFGFGAWPPWPEEYGGGFIEYEGHTFYVLVPPAKYFKEHPEYYSEIDGKRVIRNEQTGESAELCLTNPDVLRIAIEAVKANLRNPEIDIMSVSQMDDTGTYCRCAKCREIDEREGTPMGSILTFVNKIAEAIEKEFPDKAVITFSYTYSVQPPKTIKPRKNVIICLAPITACFSHPMEDCEKNVKFKEAIEGWHKLGANIFILDYAADFSHYLLPLPDWGSLKKNIQFYVKNGVVGIYAKEDTGTPDRYLYSYLLTKLMVDPDTDVDVAENEFLEAYYGKAAGVMRQYFDMLTEKVNQDNLHFGCGAHPNRAGEDGVSVPMNTLLTPEVISRAEKIFDEAEKLVQGDDEKFLRIQRARLGILYFKISTRTPKDPKRPDAIARFLDIIEKCPEFTLVREGGSMEEYRKKTKKIITRNVRCVFTNTPPKIDGSLNDECWKASDIATDFMGIRQAGKPDALTEVRVLYDGTSLYAGYTCYEPQMKNLTANVPGEDSNVFSDDSIEIFLDTDHDMKTYYQLAVSAAGGTYDSKQTDTAWDSGMEVKVGKENAQWNVEMRIPLSAIGISTIKDGTLWGVNFCRNRPGDKVASQSWSYRFDTFQNPNKFGNMEFRVSK